MKLKKYRIVTDRFAGYECQCWRIYFPFWIEMHNWGRNSNTFKEIKKAKEFIKEKKINNKYKIVWEEK